MGDKVAVIVGRFQVPELHDGHKALLTHALRECGRLIVFIGTTEVKNSRKDPLSFYIRRKMILDFLTSCSKPSNTVIFMGKIPDISCDTEWSKNLDAEIVRLNDDDRQVILYGGRDSFLKVYNGGFETRQVDEYESASGTKIRDFYGHDWFPGTEDARGGIIHAAYNRYPTVYSCVDIALVHGNKVLLARKEFESKWRFPGGFVDIGDANLKSAASRELKEECNTDINPMFFDYVESFTVNDWRYNGREDKIMTHLFMVRSESLRGFDHILAEIKAGDDIHEVRWFDAEHDKIADNIVDEHKPLYESLCDYFYFG